MTLERVMPEKKETSALTRDGGGEEGDVTAGEDRGEGGDLEVACGGASAACDGASATCDGASAVCGGAEVESGAEVEGSAEPRSRAERRRWGRDRQGGGGAHTRESSTRCGGVV